MLATREEVDEIASQAVYDGRHVTHIAIPHSLPLGTSTVWIEVKRVRTINPVCASLNADKRRSDGTVQSYVLMSASISNLQIQRSALALLMRI